MSALISPENIKFDAKAIMKLSWPIFVEHALGATVGLADTVMVSHVGDTAVSAVGLVDSINMLFLSVFLAIATGTTVVIAQMYGRRDRKGILRCVGQSSLLMTSIMIVVSLLVLLFKGQIFDLLYPRVETAVRTNGLNYFLVTAASYPAIALFSNLAAVFRGKGHTRISMQSSVVVNIINISLNALFIYGFSMGVVGAALATTIARIVGCLILIAAEVREDGRHVFSFENMRLSRDILKPLLGVSLPAGLDALLFQSGKIIVSVFIGILSTGEVSAHVIAGSTFGIISIPGNALAVAATTAGGQCYGAGLKRQARNVVLRCTSYSTALLAVMSLILYFPAPLIIGLYNPTKEALPIAIKLFRLLLVMIPTFWSTAFVTSNGLRAVADVKFVTAVSVVSMWTMRVFSAWLLGIKFGMGAYGIMLAMGLDWVLRTAFYVPRLFLKKSLRTDEPIELDPEIVAGAAALPCSVE